MAKPIHYSDILETGDSGIYDIQTHAAGSRRQPAAHGGAAPHSTER